MTTYCCTFTIPLGPMIASAKEIETKTDGKTIALTGLWFLKQKHYPSLANTWTEKNNLPIFASLRAWLKDYFAGKNPLIDLPLATQGTPFQEEVWKLLQKIPYGELVTYGQLARQIAKKQKISAMSAQAVGGAVGRNPITILIPCHRVVGSNNTLTGYASGVDKKKALLTLEKAVFHPRDGK